MTLSGFPLRFASLLAAVFALSLAPLARSAPNLEFWTADTTFIEITDCAAVSRPQGEELAWPERPAADTQAYRVDAAGARIRFRCDSRYVSVHLAYGAPDGNRSRNSIGVFRIDDRGAPDWRFTRPIGAQTGKISRLVLELPIVPEDSRPFRDYEVILPYGDAVALAGVEVEPFTRWEHPARRADRRWVAFGDTATHGFGASDITRSYPFLTAEKLKWEVINTGATGRLAKADDGVFLGQLSADVFSIALGASDWRQGVDPAHFRREVLGLLTHLRAARPEAKIVLITPPWTSPGWRPADAKFPLDAYREALRSVARSATDKNLHLVEGTELIPSDPALFDHASFGPVDAGFAIMAQRLAEKYAALLPPR